MKYRKLSDRIDFMPSALGFGLMRLPLKEDNTLDVDESVRIVRYAIDNGVNYLDTAYMYHGGESERVMAKILKDGYREKVKIADKFPCWMLKDDSDRDRIFNDQLAKMEVDKIDFYLLHALGRSGHKLIEQYKMIDWIKQKKADGLVDYIGFSFHDDFDYLKEVIDLCDWDFCQLQFNFVDIKDQLGYEALQYAHQRGLGIIIMEALRGGQLTISIPEDIQAMWREMSKVNQTPPLPPLTEGGKPVQLMLDWVWHYPEVGTILSGMSNFEQVEQNLLYADQSEINKLTPQQMALFDKIADAYRQRIAINCTDCKYCKDCPQKVSIPYIFKQMNECQRYENQRTPTFRYGFLSEDQRASKCNACGACVPLCPQKLDIPALLKKAVMVFEEKKDFSSVMSNS